MKLRIVLTIIVCFTSLGGILLAKTALPPTWYRNLTAKDKTLIGYGSDKSLENAKAMARREIAEQIEISISSENEFSSLEINGSVEEKAKSYLLEKVNVSLESLFSIREEALNGIYYVALGYDNLPLVQKIARALEDFTGVREPQNRYLAKTTLIRNLNQLQNGSLAYHLIRSSGRWWLTYSRVSHPLSNLDILQLLSPIDAELMSISCSVPSPMWEKTVFSIAISGGRPGYYSLLNVYENGEVFVLENNRYAEANETWNFPAPTAEFEFTSGLIVPGKGTHDLYMLIYSPTKLNLNRFAQAGSVVQTEEYFYQFGELIELIDDPLLDFETIVLHIKPQNK